MTDKRLVSNLAGLNAAHVRQVEYALHMCSGDDKLPWLYKRTLQQLENLVELIMTEIDSLQADLHFWETLSCSTVVETWVLQWHVSFYRYARYQWNKRFPDWQWAGTTGVQPGNKPVTRKMCGIMRNSMIASREDVAAKRAHAAAVANASPDSPMRAGMNEEEIEEQEQLYEYDVYGNVDEHIFVLRFDLQQLFCMLASTKEASEHLRRVYTEIAVTSQRTVATRTRGRRGSSIPPQMADQLYKFACQNISYCLRDLLVTIRIYDVREQAHKRTFNEGWTAKVYERLHAALTFVSTQLSPKLNSDSPPVASDELFGIDDKGGGVGVPQYHSPDAEDDWVMDMDDHGSLYHTNRDSSGSSGSAGYGAEISGNGTISIRNQHILKSLRTVYEDLSSQVRIFQSIRGGYPLQMTEHSARRPSYWERLWLRDLVLSGLAIWAGSELLLMHRSGYLRELQERAATAIAENMQEHLVEPLQNLSQYVCPL